MGAFSPMAVLSPIGGAVRSVLLGPLRRYGAVQPYGAFSPMGALQRYGGAVHSALWGHCSAMGRSAL